MTGLPGRSVRAVPSVLLALLCSVLAAYPAAAAPAWESVSRAGGVAVTATYHVDIAAVASRSDSPAGSQHSTPAFEACGGNACGAPANGAVAAGALRPDPRTEAFGSLPAIRAPPAGETT